MQISFLGEILQDGFDVFADEKDHLISLTPLYLLSGLSFPLWMPTTNLTRLALLSGVLTIGIGDSAASLVGTRWGSHKWNGTNKTVEGTISCVLCQISTIFILSYCGKYFISYIFLPSCLYIARSFISFKKLILY